MNVKSLILHASSVLLFVSCDLAQTPKETPPAPKNTTDGPQLVGRIASVPTDQKFVLIQSYGKWKGATGQVLTTRGPNNRTANLKTTGEILGEFLAADIQSGSVESGDAVYSLHVPSPVKNPETPETPQLPENAPFQNVQKNN